MSVSPFDSLRSVAVLFFTLISIPQKIGDCNRFFDIKCKYFVADIDFSMSLWYNEAERSSNKEATAMKIKRYDTSDFGKRLRSLRAERGYSMDTFCEKYNESTKQRLSKSTVSRWENNTQEPMLSTVASIADFFGVTSLWLLGETDDRSCSAANIQNSAVVQGNNATTLIVRNGKEGEMPLSDMESELLRIFQSLSVRGQTQLLTRAFELESEEKGES